MTLARRQPVAVHTAMRQLLDEALAADGFGVCTKHAPERFSLDDWGYASLVGDGSVPVERHDAVRRAILDCPVHAVIEPHHRRSA